MDQTTADPHRTPGARTVKKILAELDWWVSQGLVSSEAASAIRERYPEPATDNKSRLVTVLSVMAAVMLGLGVILFFASNWDQIPRFAKFAISVTVMVAAYGAGLVLRDQGLPRVGGAMVFLGTILYGSAIYLVAQAYQINEHFANGMLLWAAGILPLAVINRSSPILVLFTAVFCAWSGTETFYYHNFGPTTLIVILAVILPLAYWQQSRAAVFAGILALGYFLVELMAFDLDRHDFFTDPSPIPAILATAGFAGLLWAAGSYHRFRPGLGKYVSLYQTPALMLMMLMVYLFSFSDVQRELHQDHDPTVTVLTWIAAAVLILAQAGYLIWRARSTDAGDDLYEGVAALGLTVVMALSTLGANNQGFAVLVNNILCFGLAAGLVVQGYRHGRALLINFGLLFFAVMVITRYIDLFWKMMSTSMFFIVGGAILLAGGIMLERQRRRMLAAVKEVKS